MTRKALADAFNKLAEAAAIVAIELEADEQPGAPAATAEALPPAPAVVDTQTEHINAALGVCPVHRTAWESRPGGVSQRTGKPYKAFWTCNQRIDGAFCKEKPAPAWADTHPIAA
jgi:hypothetical protein